MTLQIRLTELATAIGKDVKTLRQQDGVLATLKTTAKASLVAAINELFDLLQVGGGAGIADDKVGTDTTYSSQRIVDLLAQLKADILGGADPAFDTLKKLQAALENEQDAVSALLKAVGQRLSIGEDQGLTSTQKQIGRDNLDVFSRGEIGDIDVDLAAVFLAAQA
ncbi:hypothetical protein HA052_22910 [Chromobacterium haemolyticum]|uniref:Uncharacterized protein n=1 Tax=Chromobacterium fluminis TaxID=3044269 RepID=A0ABX0LB86_9NEIS|nr:hypothetical protein [Chromobacterium haemolyticum]NHR08045.1 hypothetical protein [Chromobacterium haemolyticum]